MTPIIKTLMAKEIRCFVVSPVFYVVGAVFLFVSGVLAHLMVVNTGQQAIRFLQIQNTYAHLNLNEFVFRPIFHSVDLMLIFLLPMLTMRLFAEEYKLHTMELLLTSPIGINELIVAKFLSVLCLYLGLLGLTGLTPFVLSFYSAFHWGPILTGYLGLALQGAFFLSCGVLASTLTENQIVAAFLSFGIIILLWLLSGFGAVLGDTTLGQVISYLSFAEHYERLVRGLLEAKDIVYYLSGTVWMLFIAHRVVDAHRWQ